MTPTNILITGVGGQGIVLASKLLAATAMARGIPVQSAETIGMAQKGGSVFSFLRIGGGAHAPMFPKGSADLLLAFEPAEAVRMLPYLKADGAAVVNTHPVLPVTSTLGGTPYTGLEMVDYLRQNVARLTLVDGDAACRAIGSPKVLNMVLLGASVRLGTLPFSVADVKETMHATVRPQFHALNDSGLDWEPPQANA